MSAGGRPEPGGPSGAGNHFSCSLSAVLLARVRDHGGDPAVSDVLRRAGSRRSVAYLNDIGNWISFHEGLALWRAGAEVTLHPQFARAVGEDAVRRLSGSPVATLLRSLGSPEAVYRQIATTAAKYSTASTLEAVDCGPGYAEIVSRAVPGFPRHPDHCAWTCGMLSQPPILFGLPPAIVHHERCAAWGAPACEYRVTWPLGSAGGGTGGMEESLRGQLTAMKLRLESMFQTAADLIGSGDVEEVLAQIADRAALEVRAPRHLLAVRMSADGPLHCHQRGFAPDEVQARAQRLLSCDPGAVPDSWLVVPVASTRREYGRLLATQEDGGSFFEQERELLQVYARYAASALDGAVALREAESRWSQSSALLDLARELAAAGTSAEIAERLAHAVPLVVDCDRVGVYLWDQAVCELARAAETGQIGAEGAGLAAQSAWRPVPGGTLERFVDDPNREPVLIEEDSEPLGRMLRELGFVATVLVPLAPPGELLGLLSVSVLERPERLALSGDLLDRLSGVAAQATTALQSGRLVDVITHQALHDQLTGLANRLSFTNELQAALRRAAQGSESGALLYVDLDRFKPVNDEFG
ncbi:MAG: diguanylate cyclase domain-containing protein, partial [Solirubrobacteraceae bacterium]